MNARSQTGVALLTVLLVLAIASITAVNLAEQQQLSLRRSEVLLHRQQAKQYLLGAERWALAILRRDRAANETDHADEDWARVPPALPVTGGYVSGQLSDLQARFNLNNMLGPENAIDEQQVELFKRLLEQLNLAPGIAAAVADWLDEDVQARFPDGAEDSDYLLSASPYLAANQRFADPSELRLIKGIDAATYQRLRPFICTLPGNVPVNINTASAELLAALDPAMDIDTAQQLVDERKQQEFTSSEGFIAAIRLPDLRLRPEDISVSSDYFQLNAEAEVGTARVQLRSILNRSAQQGIVISRSYGTDA